MTVFIAAIENYLLDSIVWENMGLILNMSRIIVNLVLEFPNFRCHSNRGLCDTNFTYWHTVTLAYPINPFFGARIAHVA